MDIYLIRHTTPAIEKGICYGQSDILPAATFETEWTILRKKLPSKVNAIFSSPLARCMRLGQKLGEHYALPVLTDERLMEMHFGEWEMKKWEKIDQDALRNWMNNYTTVRCPGGESYTDVVQRVKSFAKENLQSAYRKVLIVTHGGVIKCFHGIVNNCDGMSLKVDCGEIYHFNGVCSHF